MGTADSGKIKNNYDRIVALILVTKDIYQKLNNSSN
jgi:hypothetical protein